MTKQILVIDDDALARITVEQVLASACYRVTCAADGEEGIRLFRSLHPDLVIADLIMPIREGIETILEMKREQPQVTIIAMSGGGRLGTPDILKMARQLGADYTIAKPFRSDELTAIVRQSLARNV
jgi:DNA-binding response OmpR family regulator